MKNLKLGLLSLLAILAVSVFLTSCEQEIIEQPLITDYEKGEQRLGDYIIEQDGAFVLTEKDPYKLGIEPTLFEDLLKGFEAMNEMVKKGELKASQINTEIEIPVEDGAVTDRDCGSNKVKFHWTSYTIYLSKDYNNLLVGAGGCNAAGLVAGVVAGAVTVNPVVAAGSGFTVGVLCGAMVWAFDRWNIWCSCGFKYNFKYWSPTNVNKISCQ